MSTRENNRMASMQADINGLVARCRKLGWRVTASRSAGGGWRIVCPDKHVKTVHSSYSDRNSFKNVLKELDAHGLSAAEAEAEAAHAKEVAERHKADLDAAETKSAKLARDAAHLARAAGPYAEPEEVPYSWFTGDHPAPWQRWCVITPTLAKQLLTHNTDNRPMRPLLVAHYRRSIEAGLWRRTHQGGAMDTNKVLQDSQHRLQACVDADIPIVLSFYVGMDPDNFKAIDEGKVRSIGDLLGKAGEGDVNLLGTVTRLVAAAREPFPHSYLKGRTPNSVLYDEFKGDPDALRDSARWGRTRAAEARMVASAIAAARYLLQQTHGTDNDYVNAFMSGLVTGVKGTSRIMLDADDPRLQLRNELQKRREHGRRTAAIDQLIYILWAWNNVCSGRRARYVRWAEVPSEVPTITICRDQGRGASAPPELLRGEFKAAHQ